MGEHASHPRRPCSSSPTHQHSPLQPPAKQMAALARAWQLTAPHCQPLGLRRVPLVHRARHAGVALARAAPGGQPSRSLAAAAGAGTRSKTRDEMKEAILEFYANSRTMCERLLGNHLHHGFYDPGATPSDADARQGLVRMMEEALRFAGVSDDPHKRPKKIVDVGCGLGAGTIYLAKKFGAKCEGINISPPQVESCQALAAAEGLADRVTFHLADALKQPFPDGQFDLVWCMEAVEHIPDKREFLEELVRVAAPGATIVITGLVQRDLSPGEDSLRPDEVDLLNTLGDAFHFVSLCSIANYVKIAESLSLQDIKTVDWTENVKPFWSAVLGSVMTVEGSRLLLEGGWTVIKRVLMGPTMLEAFNKKLIKYAAISFRKPW